MTNSITEPARHTPVIAEADVVVLGGGPAGIAAAASAARTGASTILLERYGFLGGMGTAAMVTNFCSLHADINGSIQQVVHGIADDILDRLAKLDGLLEPHIIQGPDGLRTGAQAYDTAAYKLAADDLLIGAGVDLRFHVQAVGAIMDGPCIDAILVEAKSGRGAIRAQTFLDCSGDADLATWSGVPYALGGDDGFMAYSTLMFRLGNVNDERAAAEGRPKLRELIAEANASGEYSLPRKAGIIRGQPHRGEWRANLTQVSRDGAPLNGADADDLAFAEVLGRQQVQEYYRFLRDKVTGFEDAYLLEPAPQIGIRETRRIKGRYALDGEDVLGCKDFADSIGANGWPLETHEAGDVKWQFVAGRGYHQIPFAATVPENVGNLLVAGRCALTTQSGQASLRVSGPCFAMGQVIGTAAAMGLAQGVGPSEVPIGSLQQKLVSDGAFIGDVTKV